MQLTWSPQPQTGRTMIASVDGNAPVEYKIEGKESMGNGGTVQTGHASVLLSNGKGGKLALANQTSDNPRAFPRRNRRVSVLGTRSEGPSRVPQVLLTLPGRATGRRTISA